MPGTPLHNQSIKFEKSEFRCFFINFSTVSNIASFAYGEVWGIFLGKLRFICAYLLSTSAVCFWVSTGPHHAPKHVFVKWCDFKNDQNPLKKSGPPITTPQIFLFDQWGCFRLSLTSDLDMFMQDRCVRVRKRVENSRETMYSPKTKKSETLWLGGPILGKGRFQKINVGQ